MTVNILEYTLVDGFIHNWLVVGPFFSPLPLQETPPPPAEMPTERASFEVAGQSLAWRYYRAPQDHLIDFSARYTAPGRVYAWAYVKFRTPPLEATTLTIFSSGAIQVWLNSVALAEEAPVEASHKPIGHFCYTYRVPLQAENTLFICCEVAAARATLHSLAVRLDDFVTEEAARSLVVCVPTRAMFPHRHKVFENLFEHAYLEQFVHHKGNRINIRWSEDAEMTTSYAYKVRDERKQIYVEGNAEVKLSAYDAGHPQRIWERPYHIALQAPGREYWDQEMRYERLLPFYVLDTEYVAKPRESFSRRRKLALEHASRREPHLFAEIAKMASSAWDKVNPEHILGALERINSGDMERYLLLVGLLGMQARFGNHEKFPASILQPIETCALALDYHTPQTEAGQEILQLTAALLAGSCFPQRRFVASNLIGEELCHQAEEKTQAWLRFQGSQGLSAWTAPEEIEQMVVALTHLASLAEDETVRELATVLLDKILFLLASLSHHGVFGAAHARLSAAAVKSAQMDPTSPLNRLLFGMGVYNPHIAGPVSLACSAYEFPSFFARMAAHPPAELLHKERQISPGGQEANVVVYRTPDGLLSSVQDYRPGQPGNAEHVWQATLGADAIIYTNHPAGMGEQEGREPGFWLGNGVLPRLAQWNENLVAIYNLPEKDWLGFTHAYFPTYAFDEYVFARGWAFARLGEGFVGLTCSQGFELVKQGPGAMRELRSPGRQNVWLCILGRKAVHRGFRRFQKDCMAIKPAWRELGVAFQSLRGEMIDFGWEDPLMVNGVAQPLAGFLHLENPYCSVAPGAAQMDIQFEDILLRLNFS